MTKPFVADAQGTVKLEVRAGIAGEYKEADLIPMQVTITNQGEDISGDIVISTPDKDTLTGTYYQPIAIGKGTTKTVTMLVPGRNLNSAQVVQLMQNDQELARSTIAGRRFDEDNFFVGVLAADPDTASFLGSLPKASFSRQVRLLPLKAEDLPGEGLPLGMIDLLVINNFATDRLKEEQITAIKDWVNRGGLLVLSGGSQYGKGAAPFQDISPVAVDGVASISSVNGLVQGDRKQLALPKPFTVSKAHLQQGKILFQENGLPLFAYREINNGKVLYVAYDLIEEPLASWSGNGSLWGEVLQKIRGKSGDSLGMDTVDEYWALHNAAERIPTLGAPNITWLAILFGAYAITAGPLLFFFLRDKKKRIYIWGIVPALAIFMCLTIYTVGIFQRGTRVLVHNASFVEVNASGQAEAMTSSAIFVPTGGDYELSSPDSELMLPVNRHSRGNDEKLLRDTWVSTSSTQKRIRYKNVGHWSIRSTFLRKMVPDAGTFASDLVYQDGKLVGTVTNKTKFPLHDVKLSNGHMIQELGTLNPGQTAKVEVGSDNSIRIKRDSYRYLQSLLPANIKNDPDADMSRESNLLELLESKENLATGKPVRIFGWTEQPIMKLEVKDEKTREFNLALITASLAVKPSPNGYVYYPHGTFIPALLSSEGDAKDVGNGYYLDEGEIELEFDLRQEKTPPMTISRINVYTWSEDNATFTKKVYNWQTKKYEDFGKAFDNNTMTSDKVNTYVSPEGKLRLSFSHTYEDEKHLGYPEISVEGWVTQK